MSNNLNFHEIVAGAGNSRAMETDTILKNGASPKSHTSRGNFLKMKKLLILAFAMLLSMASAFAQDCDHSGTTGTLEWCLKNGTLTISGNGAMPDYSSPNYAPWYVYRQSILYLSIGSGVTKIGNNAFYNCSNLSALTIPNAITSIGGSAFENCNGLIGSLTIPNAVTSVGSFAFYGCNKLTSLTIGTGVTSIGNYAFNYCSGLTTVNFNATNCTSMGGVYTPVFEGCTASATLNIGNNVTKIPESAFCKFSGLTLLTMGSGVTSIGQSAFYSSGLTSLTIGSAVTSIGNSAFEYCSELTGSLIIPNGVNSIGSFAFYGCNKLASLTIGTGVTSIENYAFNYCSGLTTVNFNATNCTSMGGVYTAVFQGCTSFAALNIGNNVTKIPDAAFYGCSSITSITSFPTVPPTIYTYTFNNVSKSIPVYVLCNSLNAYQSASYWSSFTNYQAIPLSQPGNITGSTTVCAGGDAQTYSISAVPDAISYTWTLPYGWSGSSTTTSISATPGSNAQSGNVTVKANNNCGSSPTSTLTVTVNATPTTPTSINGATTVCAGGGAQTYSISPVSGATSYTWTLPIGWSGSSTTTSISAIPNSNAQNGDITVTANNSCGISPERTLAVTVHTPPATPTTITGPTTVCAGGDAQIYSISAVPDATSYTWTLPSGWSGSSTGTSISATPDADAQSGNIEVVANNDFCNSPESTLSVTVNTSPTAPASINGSTTVCAGGDAQIYSISAVPDATSYTWTLPNGWSGTSTSTSISATPGADAQSGNIEVIANNDCGSSPEKTLAVIVNTTIPTTPTAITGSTTVCAGEGAQTYSISAVSDATSYTWTLPSGWSGSSTTTTISATPDSNAQSGNIQVTADNGCGSSPESTLAITVNTPPTAPTGIDGTNAIEAGESTTLTASGGDEGSGCIYQWGTESCGNNIVSSQTGISITVSPTTTTTYWVRRIGDSPCNGITTDCATITVTVNQVGIDEISGDNIKIFPNPVKDELTITNYDLGITIVKIYDLQGKEVMERRLSDGKVDVSQLSPGTYILKTGAYIGKFVKE